MTNNPSEQSTERHTRNKKLLGARGLTTRSKDATRGSWHRYERSILTTRNKKLLVAKGIASCNKCLTSSNKKLLIYFNSNSFLLLLVRHLFLVARHLLLASSSSWKPRKSPPSRSSTAPASSHRLGAPCVAPPPRVPVVSSAKTEVTHQSGCPNEVKLEVFRMGPMIGGYSKVMQNHVNPSLGGVTWDSGPRAADNSIKHLSARSRKNDKLEITSAGLPIGWRPSLVGWGPLLLETTKKRKEERSNIIC